MVYFEERWSRTATVTMLLALISLAGLTLGADASPRDGVIEGVVVRAVDRTPVAGAEVVLRAKVDGQLVAVAERNADALGRFRFDRLPTDGANVFLPGANHDGIHYPGAGVRLSSRRRRAEVTLAVHDTTAFPNPLVLRRHTIMLSPGPGVLRVTESMLIDNPTAACYVGQSVGEDAEPVTLQLGIPSDFAQVTFVGEFFGRRFSLVDGKLVTGVPWPPGERKLAFSYVLPNPDRHFVWQRPLDLPSAKVRICVSTDQPDQTSSNLGRSAHEENGNVVFESSEHSLSAGYVLRVELGHLPVPPLAYAPWTALTILGGLILGTSFLVICRRTVHGRSTAPTSAQSAVDRII
jgi:hypothetical protein